MNVAISGANFFAGAILAASLATVCQSFQPASRANEPRREIQIFVPKADPENLDEQDSAPPPQSDRDTIDPDDKRPLLVHAPNDPIPS